MRPDSGTTGRTVATNSHAQTVANSIGMKLKLIPAGEFQMGSTEYDNEKPRHLVTITAVYTWVCTRSRSVSTCRS